MADPVVVAARFRCSGEALSIGRQSTWMVKGLSRTGLPQWGQGITVLRADSDASDRCLQCGQPKASARQNPRQ